VPRRHSCRRLAFSNGFHSLAVWLNELDDDDWDKEMGRGMAWVEKIQHAIAEGTARPLILFT
jgi:hypothetical protein